jgi:archaellin
LIVKWLSTLVIVIIVAAVIAAGCADEENSNPLMPAADAVLPGQVLMNMGNVTGNGIPRGTIDTITFTVGLVPGEKSVNVENISIVYADAIRTESLVPVEGFYGDPPPGSWGILEVQNQVGTPNNRLEFEERLVIRINPKAPLVPLQFVTIIVKPPSGTSLTIRRVSPPTIIKENNLLTPV